MTLWKYEATILLLHLVSVMLNRRHRTTEKKHFARKLLKIICLQIDLAFSIGICEENPSASTQATVDNPKLILVLTIVMKR
jgi:hypothetical protein